LKNERKANRVYYPETVELKAGGREYKVHSISASGLGFFTDDSSQFQDGGSIIVSLGLDESSLTVKGSVIHISLVSDILSNLPNDEEKYLCGIEFDFENKEVGDSIKRFLNSHV